MPNIRFTVYGPAKGYFIPFLDDSRTEAYRLGYAGSLDVDEPASNVNHVLSRIFNEGNGEGAGPGFTVSGRSMSTGDVVHLDGRGCWFCASVGWTALGGDQAARFPLAAGADCTATHTR